LPIYSGGLGILAGDLVKEASDMGLPLVAVGFLYPQGYFRQRIDAEGNQLAEYPKLHFVDAPAVPARTQDGNEVVVEIELAGRMTYAKVYRVQVGRIPIFLMDTDIHPNSEQNRELLARLYAGDDEMRVAQEMILGVGGVRALRQLGINPTVWHMNEGHAAFLVLELMRELVAQGKPFDSAMREVQSRTVFTMHTPGPSSRDVFHSHLIEKFFWRFRPQLGLSHDTLMNLARYDRSMEPAFSMTALALNCSNYCNGVSQIHERVARRVWQWMYPEQSLEQVPITAITNGIHTASWLAPELRQIFDAYLGPAWEDSLDDSDMWQRLYELPNDILWSIRRKLKHQLIAFVRERTRQRFQHVGQSPSTWPLLHEDGLTIGFARRFAAYKRADLIVSDQERIITLLNDPVRPVQIIFAGKAHPNDEVGKQLIQEIDQLSRQPEIAGRIVVLEEYDTALSRELVRGVDLWLNTPRFPSEACGTSGQKASLNGVPNLSIMDGWWPEAANGRNGWVIGTEREPRIEELEADAAQAAEQDREDALSLYDVLESRVIPLFYDERDDAGVPNGWVEVCKEAIITIAPRFSTRRMLTEYVEQFYRPAANLAD
jgi:starch phosphorylase